MVLVVDDDEAVVLTLAALLEDAGFTVLTATSGPAAERLLARQAVDVVCADHGMPGTTGSELLAGIASRSPHIGRILVTGQREYFDECEPSAGRYGVLLKPYDPARLIRMVAQQARMAQMKRAVGAMNSAAQEKRS